MRRHLVMYHDTQCVIQHNVTKCDSCMHNAAKRAMARRCLAAPQGKAFLPCGSMFRYAFRRAWQLISSLPARQLTSSLSPKPLPLQTFSISSREVNFSPLSIYSSIKSTMHDENAP